MRRFLPFGVVAASVLVWFGWLGDLVWAQTAMFLTPTPIQHFDNANGAPCSGCKVFTYQAGTTTKLVTYTSASGGTPNADPIILNSRGEAPIWIPPGTGYKFVLAPANDTDPPTNPIWTVDQITVPGPPSPRSVTAAYTAVAADCGRILQLGGSSLYTLTVNAAASYGSGCVIQVANVDAAPPTGRGKRMAINSTTFPNTVLYPGQSFVLTNVSSTWVMSGVSRYKAPGTTVNLYADFSNGNDTNDGFAAGAGNAKKTIQGALDQALNDIDFSGLSGLSGEPTGQTILAINVLAGSTDTNGVHFSPHAFVGAQGGGAVLIQGNGGTATVQTSGNNVDAMGFFVATQIQLKNLQLKTTGTNTNCLTAGYEADVRLLSGMTFGPCVTADINIQDNAGVTASNDYGIGDTGVGNSSLYHYAVQNRGRFNANAAITVSGNKYSSGTFALASSGALIDARNVTFTAAAASMQHASATTGATILSATEACDTDFPGTVATTVSTGGRCGNQPTCTVSGASPQTCNGLQGVVTSDSLTTAAGAAASYTINNSVMASTSAVNCSINGYGGTTGTPVLIDCKPSAGNIVFDWTNVAAADPLNGTLKFMFQIVNQ